MCLHFAGDTRSAILLLWPHSLMMMLNVTSCMLVKNMASVKTTRLNWSKPIVFMFKNSANGQNNLGRCWVKVKRDISTEKVFSRIKRTRFSNLFGGLTARPCLCSSPSHQDSRLVVAVVLQLSWQRGQEGRVDLLRFPVSLWVTDTEHCSGTSLPAIREAGMWLQKSNRNHPLWLGAMVTALTAANKRCLERGLHLYLLWQQKPEEACSVTPL